MVEVHRNFETIFGAIYLAQYANARLSNLPQSIFYVALSSLPTDAKTIGCVNTSTSKQTCYDDFNKI